MEPNTSVCIIGALDTASLMAHGSAKLSRSNYRVQTLLIYVSVPESLSCLDENAIPERGVREFFRSAIR
jgi:hypothetical protein